MIQVERMITVALGRLGNAANPALRQLNLAAMLGQPDVAVPGAMEITRRSQGPDAYILGSPTTVVEVKRSSDNSKLFGPHVLHVEGILARGVRANDPDAAAWFSSLKKRVETLPTELQGWHSAKGPCWDNGQAGCYGWFHTGVRKGWTHVGVPQPAAYLYGNYAPPHVTVSGDSKLVVLGGYGSSVDDFYGEAPDDHGRNPARFVLTTHVRFLNSLAAGLPSGLLDEDRELVTEVATLMWLDMTWEEAGDLAADAHDLVAPYALDLWCCDCESCLRRRGPAEPGR